jgi:hypothetical protein
MDISIKGVVHRARPDANPEYTDEEIRLTKYGEAMVASVCPTSHIMADEGSFFTAYSPTPGTGLAFAITAAASDTAGNFLLIKNNDNVSDSPNNKRIYLSYIKLICTVAPVTATAGQFKMNCDGFLTARYTSGGTVLTPQNLNMDLSSSSISQVYAGALTTVALSNSARQVGRGVLRTVIPAVNDEYIFHFGSVDWEANQSLATATAIRESIPCPPIILGPQQSFTLGLWFPGNATTAGSFEVECGWWER